MTRDWEKIVEQAALLCATAEVERDFLLAMLKNLVANQGRLTEANFKGAQALIEVIEARQTSEEKKV